MNVLAVLRTIIYTNLTDNKNYLVKNLFVDAPTLAMPLLGLLTPVAIISSAQRHLELLRATQAHRIAPGPTVNYRDRRRIFLGNLRSAQVCQLLFYLIRMKLSFIN